jgi:hypothetical protein
MRPKYITFFLIRITTRHTQKVVVRNVVDSFELPDTYNRAEIHKEVNFVVWYCG